MVRVLRADGLRVVEARDGEELLDHLSLSETGAEAWPHADLVITDFRMPKADGLDALALFGHSAAPPFIVITAFGSAETHQRAFQLGAAAVLDKPVDIDELRAEVRRHLEPLESTHDAPDTQPRSKENHE